MRGRNKCLSAMVEDDNCTNCILGNSYMNISFIFNSLAVMQGIRLLLLNS